MKKSLKLVAIFIGVLLVVVVGGTSGYILISNNQTYYIYDLRLVEPLEDANGYIYSDDTVDYVKLDNRKVYLKNASEDYLNVAIYANTSNGSSDITLSTSDSSVAYFDRSVAGELRVRYVKEGNVTLSASIGSVTSSFDLTVYNIIPSSFQVFDYDYYGQFAEEPQFVNLINTYSDNGTTYYYNYKVDATEDASGNLVNNEDVNNANLKVDYYDTTLFQSVTINQTTKQLVLTCLPDVSTGDGTTQIVIQSFYEDKDVLSVVDSYIVNVNIQANRPEFLQVELSTSPNFDEDVFYVDAQNMKDVTNEQIIEQFDEYVKYQKTEMYLGENHETPLYDVYYTDQFTRLYLKFRTVYTNGMIEYVKLGTELSFDVGGDKVHETYFGDSYYLDLTKEDFDVSQRTYSLSVSLNKDGVSLSHTFDFKYYELNQDYVGTNGEDDFWNFYAYDSATQTYSYIYWDYRAKNLTAITRDGRIVGFGNISPDLSKFQTAGE